jgi:hypothetical protein
MKLLVSNSRCLHQFTTHFTGNWHASEGNAVGSKSACSHITKKGTKIFSTDQLHLYGAEYHFWHRLYFLDQSWFGEWSSLIHTHKHNFYQNIKWPPFTVYNFQENNCTEHVQPHAWLYGNLQFFIWRIRRNYFILYSSKYGI